MPAGGGCHRPRRSLSRTGVAAIVFRPVRLPTEVGRVVVCECGRPVARPPGRRSPQPRPPAYGGRGPRAGVAGTGGVAAAAATAGVAVVAGAPRSRRVAAAVGPWRYSAVATAVDPYAARLCIGGWENRKAAAVASAAGPPLRGGAPAPLAAWNWGSCRWTWPSWSRGRRGGGDDGRMCPVCHGRDPPSVWGKRRETAELGGGWRVRGSPSRRVPSPIACCGRPPAGADACIRLLHDGYPRTVQMCLGTCMHARDPRRSHFHDVSMDTLGGWQLSGDRLAVRTTRWPPCCQTAGPVSCCQRRPEVTLAANAPPFGSCALHRLGVVVNSCQ